MKVVPAAFFQSDKVEKLLVEGMSCVLVKRLAQAAEDNERYVAAHALTFVLSGGLRVEDEEGALTVVNAGQFIFLPKGLYFISDLIPEEGEFLAVVCFFGGQMLEEWADEMPMPGRSNATLGKVIPTVLETSPPISIFLDQLMALYGADGPHAGEVALVKLEELLFWMGKSEGGPVLAKAVSALRTRNRRPLQAFMESNFAKPLAVEDYAYLSGRSISSFHRDFKRVFGEAPKTWLRRRRLEVARDRLLDHGNVTEVAASLGYGNASHFIKIFRAAYGESPKQWTMRERRGE